MVATRVFLASSFLPAKLLSALPGKSPAPTKISVEADYFMEYFKKVFFAYVSH